MGLFMFTLLCTAVVAANVIFDQKCNTCVMKETHEYVNVTEICNSPNKDFTHFIKDQVCHSLIKDNNCLYKCKKPNSCECMMRFDEGKPDMWNITSNMILSRIEKHPNRASLPKVTSNVKFVIQSFVYLLWYNF